MQICSKCQTQVEDTLTHCSNCDADLREWSTTAKALKRIQDNPRIVYVRVAVAEDCCPTCREVEGAYAKEAAPMLPIEGCSNYLGCKCFYQPVLEEIYP